MTADLKVAGVLTVATASMLLSTGLLPDGSAVRLMVVVLYLVAAPGFALCRLTDLRGLTSWVVTVALSLAVVQVVAMMSMYTGLWDATTVLWAVGLLTVAAAWWPVLHRSGRQVRPPAHLP